MKHVSQAVVAAIVLGSIGLFSVASASDVSNASQEQKAREAEKIVNEYLADRVKLDQDIGVHAKSEVIESDAAAVSRDKRNLKALTGK